MNLNHIAIIPDGNRRWAKTHGLESWEGHREGSKRLEELGDELFRLGVPYFTFWAGSEANLTKRTPIEVKALNLLLKEELKRETPRFIRDKIRFRLLGRWSEILHDTELDALAAQAMDSTKHFTEKNLTLLFGYDGRSEMLAAINKLSSTPASINEASLKSALWTGELPPVDLVIRTGGEPHWSAGFMMWHTADSQLYFTEKLFPEFDKAELHEALEEFATRERRFGK